MLWSYAVEILSYSALMCVAAVKFSEVDITEYRGYKYVGESLNKFNLSIASLLPFWQPTVSDNIGNFINKEYYMCRYAVMKSQFMST